jgi:toluene monooxygenase system protein A
MAVLNRTDWYDVARTTNWTPKYVTEDELFPQELSGSFDIPMEK